MERARGRLRQQRRAACTSRRRIGSCRSSRRRASRSRAPRRRTRLTPAWEEIAAEAAAPESLDAGFAGLRALPEPARAFVPAASDLRARKFPAGPADLEAAAELNARIKKDFAYDTKATEVTTSPADAFAARRGVCQDFAHIMIAGLRWLESAGYVRERLHPHHPAARQAAPRRRRRLARLGRGLVRPPFGWLGLDPTNAIPEGDDHIVVARGRDYADVPPVDGVILSYGGHKLDVAVDVVPVGGK